MASLTLQELHEELDLYQTLLRSCSPLDSDPETENIKNNYRMKVEELTKQCRELQQAQRQQSSASHTPNGSGMSFLQLPNRKRSRAELEAGPETNAHPPSKLSRPSPAGSRSSHTVESDEDSDAADLKYLGEATQKHKARAFEFERRRMQEKADEELARKLQEEIDIEEQASFSQPAPKQENGIRSFSRYSQATFDPTGSFSAPAPHMAQKPPMKPSFTNRQHTPVSVASDDEHKSSDDDSAIAVLDPDEFHRRFPATAPSLSRTLPASFGQNQPASSRSSYTSLPGTSVYGGFPNFPGLPGAASAMLQAGYQATTGVLSRIGLPGSSASVPFDVDQNYQFPHSRRPWMDAQAFDPPQNSEETEKQLRDLLNNIRPDEEISPEEATVDAELEGMLKITLMPHQKKGLIWMKKAEASNKGGILADDMGLGKTIQAISLMLSRPPPREKKLPTLIVCPVALMDQWRREFKKLVRHRHQFTVLVLHGAKSHIEWEKIKHHDVILTSYGTLGSELNRKKKWEEKLKLNPDAKKTKSDHTPVLNDKAMFHRIFLDEAQNIKNRNTLTAMAACRVNATYRWCLTGTPMQNGPDEMYSLIKFCRIPPYNSYEKWAKDIGRPLKGKSEHGAQTAMRKLQAVLKAILLRRTKKSTIDGQPILQLPEKHVAEERAVFSNDELKFYQALEQQSQIQFNRYLRNGQIGQNYSKALVLLLRLRQCCCSPQLVMNSADFVLGGGMEGLDLVQNARELPEVVRGRLEECDLECPVCYDVFENPIIFNPCGHTLCHDCFSKIVDSVHAENANDVRCPNCRGAIDTKKITDLNSFKEVFMDGPSTTVAEDAVSGDDADDSDISETESEDSDDDSDDGQDLRDFIVNDDESVKAEDSDEEDEFDLEDLDAIRPAKSERIKAEGGGFTSDFDPIEPRRLRSVKQEAMDDSAGELSSTTSSKKKAKPKKSKGKRKAKDKKKKKFMSLADLRKEGLKSRAAKKRYLKQLSKIYEPCTKIDKTLELLQSIHDKDSAEKVIVFSSFTSFLDLIEVPLHQHPDLQNYTRYDGSMTAKDRNDAILRFTDNPECKIILVSLKAGNAGLNLTAANHVILLDPFWNPFVEYQAADRCHRIGQQREVYIHRVVIGEEGFDHKANPEHRFTVEDRILQLQEQKRKLVESALDENAASTVSRLGTRELGFLFGVNQLPAIQAA